MNSYHRSSTERPVISVIVPAYNVESFIGPCIDSILAQSFRTIEVIVVDDGSTDNTRQVIHQYAATDARVRIVTHKNSGLAVARNTGLDLACGEYVAFVDGDDLLEPGALENWLTGARRYNASIVLGGYTRISSTGVPFPGSSVRLPSLRSGRIYVPKTVLRQYVRGCVFNMVWSVLFRRELFTHVRFTPNRLHEDAAIMPQLLSCSLRTVMISNCVYRYRDRAGSIVNTLNPRRLDSIRAQIELWGMIRRMFSDPRTRAFASTAVSAAAAGIARQVYAAGESIEENDLRRDYYRKWRHRLYSLVRRERLVSIAINPWTPTRRRITALLLVFGIRANSVFRTFYEHRIRPVVMR